MIYQCHQIDQFHHVQVLKCKLYFSVRFEIYFLYLRIAPTTNERLKPIQHSQIENQSLQTSLMSIFDEPIVSDEAIRIYVQSVAVAKQGPFEPSDADRIIYEEYVASLMISVQS